MCAHKNNYITDYDLLIELTQIFTNGTLTERNKILTKEISVPEFSEWKKMQSLTSHLQ